VNFIEKYLRIWPDHGDGSFEVLTLIALVTLVALSGLGFFRKLRD
jgi:hypothetical protein